MDAETLRAVIALSVGTAGALALGVLAWRERRKARRSRRSRRIRR